MTFFARRLPAPSHQWVLETASGGRHPDVPSARTYGGLLDCARWAGIASVDIELRYRPARAAPAIAEAPTGAELRRAIEEAMWDGDLELLDELAHCRCCCHEHTYEDCPARLWNGCRGSGAMTRADVESWVQHYAAHHGMTRAAFFGEEAMR